MTLIVATPKGLWADRKISSDTGEKCRPTCKLAGNHALVAGFAGDYDAILKAIEAVEAGQVSPKVLADCGADALIVKSGRIWEIDAGRARLAPARTKVLATGTGYAEALAFIAGRGAPTDRNIEAAFKYVFRVRDDCGKGIDFVAG